MKAIVRNRGKPIRIVFFVSTLICVQIFVKSYVYLSFHAFMFSGKLKNEKKNEEEEE